MKHVENRPSPTAYHDDCRELRDTMKKCCGREPELLFYSPRPGRDCVEAKCMACGDLVRRAQRDGEDIETVERTVDDWNKMKGNETRTYSAYMSNGTSRYYRV